MSFLDASVVLAAGDPDDAHHHAARRLLRTPAVCTLDLALYEVTNTTDLKWRDGDAGRRLRAWIWELGPDRLWRVDGPLIERAAQIVREHAITAHDAAYVAAAERAGMGLVSCYVHDLVSKGLALTPEQVLSEG